MKKTELNPKTDHYEFGGPFGTAMLSVLLPCVIFFLHLNSTKDFKLTFFNLPEAFSQMPKSKEDFVQYWDTNCFLVVVGWFLVNVFLERVLFCEKVKGVLLRDGSRLVYNISGHLQFWVLFCVLLMGKPVFDDKYNIKGFTSFDLAWLYDDYLKLASSAIVFAFGLSFYLYARSFASGALLALGGNTGNPIFDFFIGRELNPRIGTLDLKQFCEQRPGLIGWVVLNLGCAMKQQQLLGYISYEMILVNLFQGIYVWDSLYHERAILTTMDITTDGFGLMLAFGDLAWVPFTYSLQARYLVENSSGRSLQEDAPFLLYVTALNFLGYWIFRGSNSQKDAFRTDPNSEVVSHLSYLTTKTGRKLLISGWWGAARKINYTGDWLMGLSWALLTGFQTPVTYFYPIYFFVLLVHRALRDDHACSQKYGADWPKYKDAVPYVFIPKVI